MPKQDTAASLEAKQGEKMIEVKLRFWTNDIAAEPGKIVAKNAWTSGVVRMERNKSHGIEPRNPQPFHSLLDVGAIIEKVLIEHGVVLHPSRRMKKYITELSAKRFD
jgi:hypothetical protein